MNLDLSESEVRGLVENFRDSIELSGEKRTPGKDKRAFDVKYEEGSKKRSTRQEPGASHSSTRLQTAGQASKLLAVEQELSKLKKIQGRVLGMQETMEETIQREVRKKKEQELTQIRAKYKEKVKEVEEAHRKKEEQLKQEYKEKLARVAQALKDKVKEKVTERIKQERRKVEKKAEKKILEAKIRNKAVIDKLSQMYIDLKEKYKTTQGLSGRE